MATKQTILAGLATTLLLASCSQEEIIKSEPNAPNNLIGFNVSSNRASRATEIYNSSNLPKEFILGAWYHTGNATDGRVYIKDDLIRYNGGVYENGTNLRYWPTQAGEKLNFFAFQNGTENTGLGFSMVKDGAYNPHLATVSIPADAPDHQDLLYACSYDKTKPASGEVNINFKHALAQIGFMAKNESQQMHIKVSQIAIVGAYDKSTFYFGATEDEAAHWEAEGQGYMTATVDMADNNVIIPDYNTGGDAVNLTPANAQKMMMLPYSYAAETNNFQGTGTGTYIRIKCKIWNIADKEAGFAEPTDIVLHDGYLNIPFSFDWEMGKKYTYTISFGKGTAGVDENGNPILVKITIPEPTVQDWIAGDDREQKI